MGQSKWQKIRDKYGHPPLFSLDPKLKEKEANEIREPLRADILQQLTQLNHSGAINHQALSQLIALADRYIESIPLEDRKYFVYHKGMTNSQDSRTALNEFNEKYPNAEVIFEMQKRAVTLSFLPEASTLSKANWQLIQSFGEIEGEGKLVGKEYQTEVGFKGRIDIHNWATGHGYAMLSYGEQQKKSAELQGIGVKRVYYPTQEDKECFKVHFAEGLIANLNGQRLNSEWIDPKTSRSVRLRDVANSDTLFAFTGKDLFVLDKSLVAEHPDQLFHHSSLVGGKRSIAGTMEIKEGKVKMISNNSGHYKPSPEELVSVIQFMQAKGVDLSKTKVELVDPKPFSDPIVFKTVGEFLQKHGPKPAEQQANAPDPSDEASPKLN